MSAVRTDKEVAFGLFINSVVRHLAVVNGESVVAFAALALTDQKRARLIISDKHELCRASIDCTVAPDVKVQGTFSVDHVCWNEAVVCRLTVLLLWWWCCC